MKKILLLAVALFVAAIYADAQEYEYPDNEIAIGVGFGTHPFIGVAFGDAFAGAIDRSDCSDSTVGAYSVTYLRNLSKHFAVGATAVYEYMYTENKKNEKLSENFITAMPTARAYWFRSKGFGMYSRLAAGVSFQLSEDYKDSSKTEKENHCDAHFAFHAAPVACEFGSNKISGFLELGYGYQGFVNAGVKFGF